MTAIMTFLGEENIVNGLTNVLGILCLYALFLISLIADYLHVDLHDIRSHTTAVVVVQSGMLPVNSCLADGELSRGSCCLR